MFICLFGVHDTQASSGNCCLLPRTTRRNVACLPVQQLTVEFVELCHQGRLWFDFIELYFSWCVPLRSTVSCYSLKLLHHMLLQESVESGWKIYRLVIGPICQMSWMQKVFQRICICLINILGNTKMLFRTSNSWKREKMCCLDCFLSILCVYIYVVIIAFKFSKLKVQKN